MGMTGTQIGFIVGMLFTGTINTVAMKTITQMKAKGIDSSAHSFNHPWFLTVLMFGGEAAVLLLLAAVVCKNKRQSTQTSPNDTERSPRQDMDDVALLDPTHPPPRYFQPIIIIPACCDLIGTTLGNIALLYINASVWQILRGSTIVFTGIFGRIFLKRQLKGFNILGIAFAVVGLVVVGVANILDVPSDGGNSNVVFGIMLCLVGQVVWAFQFTIEAQILGPMRLPPMQVVGTEGFVGFIISGFIFMPILYFIPGDRVGNCQENVLDALVQIKNSQILLLLVFVFMASIAFYNSFGQLLTKELTAVHRTLVDACRTGFVWAAQVFLFYCVGNQFGENVDRYSILQLDGFLILFVGTAIYNGVIKLDFTATSRRILGYEAPEETNQEI